jgi:hypothetical protein
MLLYGGGRPPVDFWRIASRFGKMTVGSKKKRWSWSLHRLNKTKNPEKDDNTRFNDCLSFS